MSGWRRWRNVLEARVAEAAARAPRPSPSHQTDHLARVWKKAGILGEKTGADLEVLYAAVMLHDLGRHHVEGAHGAKSSELAEPILKQVGFPAEKTGAVLTAISQHDNSFPREKRETLTAKILYDADKCDAFGEIGVTRWEKHMQNRGLTADEVLKLLKTRWDGLSFDETRKAERANYELIVEHFKKKEM